MNKKSDKYDDQYWTDRYSQNKTGWDIGQASTPIKEYIDQLQDKSISILIPGCGNAYEAEYLLKKGFTNVTLLDISKELTDRLKEKFRNEKIKILHEDFFSHMEQYDLILEQTFFCSLEPTHRDAYAGKIFLSLNKGGKLVGVLFDKQFDENPPFGGTKSEYEKLFGDLLKINKMEPCYNSIEPRKGTELFINFEK